ncbi:MAG: carbohydrate binding family 9 domain-containing protein [Vicinamibacterales bacterium]
MKHRAVWAAALAAVVLGAGSAQAQPQQPAAPANRAELPIPIAPKTIVRENGQVVVRAIKLKEPLKLDGRLDESVYTENEPIDGFIQAVPNNGQPVSERTEAWIMFDDKNIYVAAKMYESVPESQWVANEIRRDTNQMRQNDIFGVLFDTFYDRRNGFHFYTNALGGFTDQLVTDEGNPNGDWNPVWDVRPGRFDGGWTTEMAIPFKSIRYLSAERTRRGVCSCAARSAARTSGRT